MHNALKWWGSPRNITDTEKRRRISWIELFTDLMYIIAIHNLINGLRVHYSFMNVYTFILVFMLVFDVWNNMTLFFDLHGNETIRSTVFSMMHALLIALVAAMIPNAFSGHYSSLIVVYIPLQVLVMYMWFQTVVQDPEHIITTRPYLISATIQLGLLISAVTFVPRQLIPIILSVIIVLKYSALFIERHNFDLEFKTRHIVMAINDAFLERYGQFMMIILGESIASIVEELNGQITSQHLVTFLLTSLNVIGIWWIYFSTIDAVQVKGKSYLKIVVFRGLHIATFLCLSLLSFYLCEITAVGTHLNIEYIICFTLTVGLIYLMKIYFGHSRGIQHALLFSYIPLLLLYLAIPLSANTVVILSDTVLLVLVIYCEYILFSNNDD